MILFDQICSDLLARLEAVEMIAHSDMLAVVHAWIPSSEIPPFEHFARERLDGVLTISQLKQITGDASHVPVRLKNATPFRPFERLLQMFSMPLYGSFDPTLLMAIVFPLFFGLILGDIAYGLFILGLSLWARRRWRHKPIGRDVASMGVACAVSAILFGIIFGEFLGDLGERTGMIPVYIGKFRLMPLWKHRELIINELLGVTICIGFFHIVLGLILGIIESVRMNSRRHLWESAGLLLGLIGVSLFSIISILKVELAWLPASIGLPVSLVALAISTVTLMVFCSPVAPIEIISLVGNVLSYSRLMALGVAGMVLANLANSVAASQSSIVVGIVLAIPIHALAIALGILEPTIHALRLHFVEFLPRFFIGDGRTFSPLQRKDRDHEV
jgi:V/A-type H+-transporting ATPase subunit I